MALQLRSRHASFCPHHWCTTAGGHVKSGETHEEAALRELEEETGVKLDIKFAYKDIYVFNTPKGDLNKFIATFIVHFNGPFTVNEEVERVDFFDLAQIHNMINTGEKFHPELLFLLGKHYGIK